MNLPQKFGVQNRCHQNFSIETLVTPFLVICNRIFRWYLWSIWYYLFGSKFENFILKKFIHPFLKFFFPHHPFEGRVLQHCLPCPRSPCHHRGFATSGTTIQDTTISPKLPCPMPPAPCPAPLCHHRPAIPPSCPAPSPVAPQSPLLSPRPLVLMAPHSVPQLAWHPDA